MHPSIHPSVRPSIHPSIHYRHYIILHSIPLHDMTSHHITLYVHPHIHPIIHADGQTGSQAVRHTYSHSIPIPVPTVLCFKSVRFPISLDIFTIKGNNNRNQLGWCRFEQLRFPRRISTADPWQMRLRGPRKHASHGLRRPCGPWGVDNHNQT